MADIFGKETGFYQHIERIRANGRLDAHNQRLKEKGRVHNFDAIMGPIQAPVLDAEVSAQSLSFVTNNFQAIMAQIEEVLYLDFRLNEMIPIKTDVPEGATTYSYRRMNSYGEGQFIDNWGKGASNATVSMENVPYPIQYGGIVPAWNYQDLRNAAFAGIALDSETVTAGTVGCMNHIETVGLVGDTARQIEGLTNHSDVAITAAAKTVSAMTADEKVAWVQGLASALVTNSNEIFGRRIKTGATLYLPVEQFGIMQDQKYSDHADKSVWDYVKERNNWTYYTGTNLEIKAVAELKDGAANGTDDRAIFGLNHTDVMEMAMPISPRATRIVEVDFGVHAPMEYTISGLNMKRAAGLAYIDDV